VLSSF